MALRRKTWREKLEDDKDLPRIVVMRGRLARRVVRDFEGALVKT
ncbi:MAG TPA: hypothetical protein VLJ16_10770 [Acidobacteriota bacterium]|nr:hypothetical protein [Acidobacteriota bacterium]